MARADTNSVWRLRARAVIRAALAALPKDATDADKRKALRDACPWRREQSGDGNSWPYKQWLKERRLALGPAAVGGRISSRTETPPSIVSLTLWHQRGRLCGVYCGWCGCGPAQPSRGKTRPNDWREEDPMSLGCVVCGVARREWHQGAADLARKFRGDSHPLIVADCLEEHGFDECARLLRLEDWRRRTEGR
jgi:hypothetical protein